MWISLEQKKFFRWNSIFYSFWRAIIWWKKMKFSGRKLKRYLFTTSHTRIVLLDNFCASNGKFCAFSTLQYRRYLRQVTIFQTSTIQPSNYMLKFNNRSTRTRRGICSKSAIKTPCVFRTWSSVSIVNFQHVNLIRYAYSKSTQ